MNANICKFLLLLFFLPIAADAQTVSLQADLLQIEPANAGEPRATLLRSWELQRGNLEMKTREGSDDYRGTPWAMRIAISESNDVRFVYWIDDGDSRLTDQDQPLIEETWSALDFQARAFDLPPLADGSALKLNLSPSPIRVKPDPISLDAQTFGLNFLCLKNSAVIVDDTYYIGSFTGFGEYLIAGVPGLAKVSMSFNRIRGWAPIGTYEDGVIEIDLGEGHWMSVLAVKYGPGGMDQGGPFTVYGAIDPSETSADYARELVELRLERDKVAEKKVRAVLQANVNNPYGGLGRGTIGSSSEFSKQLSRIGPFSEGAMSECQD